MAKGQNFVIFLLWLLCLGITIAVLINIAIPLGYVLSLIVSGCLFYGLTKVCDYFIKEILGWKSNDKGSD